MPMFNGFAMGVSFFLFVFFEFFVVNLGQAAYFFRIWSRKRLESAVTVQASGQKHRSMHHQSDGTWALFSSGKNSSHFRTPWPNGACVLVLCSLSELSVSIRWMWMIRPLSLCSN